MIPRDAVGVPSSGEGAMRRSGHGTSSNALIPILLEAENIAIGLILLIAAIVPVAAFLF